MSTRREFVQSLPVAGAAFAIAGNFIFEETQARAQEAAPLDAHFHPEGHFHPKGKAPSKYTQEVLRQARTTVRSLTREMSRSRRRG